MPLTYQELAAWRMEGTISWTKSYRHLRIHLHQSLIEHLESFRIRGDDFVVCFAFHTVGKGVWTFLAVYTSRLVAEFL